MSFDVVCGGEKRKRAPSLRLRREIDVPVRYTGFEIPNRFVIGYGLDFAERYRNLPYIGVLHSDLVPNGT